MKRHRRLSKSEMTGFLILFIICLIITLLVVYQRSVFNFKPDLSEPSLSEIKEFEKFKHEIEQDSIKYANENNIRTLSARKGFTPFIFDPNTADSNTLKQIGFEKWQIRNIIKYREKGGKWKNANDFSRLYGLSQEDFIKIRPYIRIAKTGLEKRRDLEKENRDSLFKTYPKKFEAGTILELNQADTTTLKGIPGIGSYYAQKICRYRERLGGFISISQLKEIEGLPRDIEKWFILTQDTAIHKIEINHSDFKKLVRHPYLNYEQVKVICKYIQKYGKLKKFEDLSNSDLFTIEDFERLAPYISFE